MRQRRRALVLLGVLVAAAVLAPVAIGRGPDDVDLAARRLAPSLAHWLGTDDLGRDLFTRTMYGARVSLAVGLLAALVSTLLGGAIGGIAGVAPAAVDRALMRLTDAALIVPRLPLLMLLGAAFAPSVPVLIVLVGAVGWMETARVVRVELRALVTRDFVQAARATGVSAARTLWRHLLPVVWPTVAVAATLAVGRAMLLESALSFFGVGVQPPTASWGNMLYQAQNALTTTPWLAIGPGTMIFVTVLTVNALGESLDSRP
ncbi:MAG: ABC transporter permease [Gemmatimonadaceae bacterium]|jgi:peptide/nickel transport system permease protein|nr:ABC transporter permease [Gemmatimonadaceae bacterium]